ncbi:hypothetical protein BJV74DRAFT_800056 [Russula compacta]|nr:hypothetical protein BJV74DRAFT_800056 [Russula compacta]
MRKAFTPDECHKALTKDNPTYTALTVTQKPSWIHAPDSLELQTASSLIMAFKDLDGSKKRDLLSTKQLFAFGVQAKPAFEQQPLKVAGDEDLMLQDPQTRTVHVPNTRKCPTSPNSPPPVQTPSSSKGKKKRRM